MKSKKRSKQPVTLLTQIQSLLSDVLSQLSSIEESVEANVRELLLVAESSVAKAKEFIGPALAPAPRHRPARRKSKSRAGRRLRVARSAR